MSRSRGLARTIAFTMASLLLLSGCSALGSSEVRERGVSARDTKIVLSNVETVSTLELLQQTTTPPSRVRMPDLGIDMRVEPHGIASDGYMSLPESPFVAGWYAYGSAPDSRTGATVIAAHVDSLPEGVGPFAGLRDSREGMAITVTDDAGEVHDYRVVSVERIDKDEVPLDRVFTATGDPHLVLVTCGGEYDWRGPGQYLDNYIVTAEKVS